MKRLSDILKQGRKKALKEEKERRLERFQENLKQARKNFYDDAPPVTVFGAGMAGAVSLFPIHLMASVALGSGFSNGTLWTWSVGASLLVAWRSLKYFDGVIDSMLLKKLGFDPSKPALSDDELLPSKIIPLTLNEQMEAVRTDLLGPESEYSKTESLNSSRIRETSRLLAEIEVVLSRYRVRGEEIPEHLASYYEMAQEAQQNFNGVREEFEQFRARTEAVLDEAERELNSIQPTLQEIDLGIRAGRLLDQSRQAKSNTEAFLEISVLKLFGKLEVLQDEGRKEIRRRALAAATSIERGTLQLSLASMDKVLAMAGKRQDQLLLPHN